MFRSPTRSLKRKSDMLRKAIVRYLISKISRDRVGHTRQVLRGRERQKLRWTLNMAKEDRSWGYVSHSERLSTSSLLDRTGNVYEHVLAAPHEACF